MLQPQHGVALDAPARPLAAVAAGTTPQSSRNGVITAAFRTKAELYQGWMPFVRGGGFFVASNRAHELGEEVFLLVSLLQDPARIHIRGKVAWINPPHASGGRPQGIGVSLEGDPAAGDIRKLVEGLLANVLGSSRPTHTL